MKFLANNLKILKKIIATHIFFAFLYSRKFCLNACEVYIQAKLMVIQTVMPLDNGVCDSKLDLRRNEQSDIT